MLSLSYAFGTIELRDAPTGVTVPPGCVWDERTRCHRAPAVAYADIVRSLIRAKTPYEDHARSYEELPSGPRIHRDARPYQTDALAAWRAARGRGVVVLPTGSGKSHVAVLAIGETRRSTLVVAPTLDAPTSSTTATLTLASPWVARAAWWCRFCAMPTR